MLFRERGKNGRRCARTPTPLHLLTACPAARCATCSSVERSHAHKSAGKKKNHHVCVKAQQQRLRICNSSTNTLRTLCCVFPRRMTAKVGSHPVGTGGNSHPGAGGCFTTVWQDVDGGAEEEDSDPSNTVLLLLLLECASCSDAWEEKLEPCCRCCCHPCCCKRPPVAGHRIALGS